MNLELDALAVSRSLGRDGALELAGQDSVGEANLLDGGLVGDIGRVAAGLGRVASVDEGGGAEEGEGSLSVHLEGNVVVVDGVCLNE